MKTLLALTLFVPVVAFAQPCFGPDGCAPVNPIPIELDFKHIKEVECSDPTTKINVEARIYNPKFIPLAGAKGVSQEAQCQAILDAVVDGF